MIVITSYEFIVFAENFPFIVLTRLGDSRVVKP